jgi:hypothetical protein
MAAERLAALHALAAWLETQPGASAAWQELEVADYGEAGFGFRAAADIAAGSVLCSIPVRLAFSALAARVSPALGPLLQRVQGLRDDDVIGACVRACASCAAQAHASCVHAAPRA